ncbi:MAG: hypothetical protein RIE31_09005 [Alphaproteobacteria bacterium]
MIRFLSAVALALPLAGGFMAGGPSLASDAERGAPTVAEPASGNTPSQESLLNMDRDQFASFFDDLVSSAYRSPAIADGSFIIGGFSPVMSEWFAYGASRRPDLFRQLLRDLQGVTDMTQRRGILESARDSLGREISNLESSQARLDALRRETGVSSEARMARTQAYYEERARLRDAEDALEVLSIWMEFPHEGTR